MAASGAGGRGGRSVAAFDKLDERWVGRSGKGGRIE